MFRLFWLWLLDLPNASYASSNAIKRIYFLILIDPSTSKAEPSLLIQPFAVQLNASIALLVRSPHQPTRTRRLRQTSRAIPKAHAQQAIAPAPAQPQRTVRRAVAPPPAAPGPRARQRVPQQRRTRVVVVVVALALTRAAAEVRRAHGRVAGRPA